MNGVLLRESNHRPRPGVRNTERGLTQSKGETNGQGYQCTICNTSRSQPPRAYSRWSSHGACRDSAHNRNRGGPPCCVADCPGSRSAGSRRRVRAAWADGDLPEEKADEATDRVYATVDPLIEQIKAHPVKSWRTSLTSQSSLEPT